MYQFCSDANLVKDKFLRSNMDDQGWVPISLIAGFPRVSSLLLTKQFRCVFLTVNNLKMT